MGGGGGVHLRSTGTWSPHMHHTAVSSPSCVGTRPGEKTQQNKKKLEYIIIFVHDF